MKIGAPKEVMEGENRVAMTPDSALQLQKLGHSCFVESGAGVASGISDEAYAAAGVTVVKSAAELTAYFADLRGKNLACPCRPDSPCYGDVLLNW